LSVERKCLTVHLADAPAYYMTLVDVQEKKTTKSAQRTYTLEYCFDPLCRSTVHHRGSCLYGRYGRYTSWAQVAKVLTLQWAHDILTPAAAVRLQRCRGVRDLAYRWPGEPSLRPYVFSFVTSVVCVSLHTLVV